MQPKDMIGLMTTSNAAAAKSWADICNEGQRTQDEWISNLRDQGISASHPNDGWVDRVNNQVQFAYPQFNDGAKIGSLIALGWPDKFKIVRITGIVERMFSKAWTFTEDLT